MLRHKVHELKFKSGLSGLVIDTPKTGVVVAEVSFRAGEFMLPKEKFETAHLMEHVLLGANKDFISSREFQSAIEQNGAYSNASTGVYDITYEIEVADFEWQRVVGLLLDAISTPKFLQEEFDSELSNVREELITRGNNHFRHLNASLREAVGMHALTDQERVKLVENVTRDDLIKHYKRTHTLSNARFIIAGNFKGDFTSIEQIFDSKLILPAGDGRETIKKDEIRKLDDPVVIRKPSVPNIYLYLDMYMNRDTTLVEKAAFSTLSTMLTETMYSRIFGTAREKGWVYGMGSGYSASRDLSNFWIGAQVSKSNISSLTRLITKEIKEIIDGNIDKADFDAAQQNLIGRLMRSGQSASGIVSDYSDYYFYDEVLDMNKMIPIVKKVTPNKIISLMQEMVKDDLWSCGFLGSISVVPARKLEAIFKGIYS